MANLAAIVIVLVVIVALGAIGISQFTGQVTGPPSDGNNGDSPPSPGGPPTPKDPVITIDSSPTEAEVDQEIFLSWTVDGEGSIPHTGIHYDFVSQTGDFGLDVTPDQTGYTKVSGVDSATLPESFVALIVPEKEGTLYFRAHVIQDDKNYWTDEQSIKIQTAPPTVKTEEFRIEADDNEFYIDNQKVTSISVSKGSEVSIRFDVRSSNVAFMGLDFRGGSIDTGQVSPGDFAEVAFTADESFDVTTYWPGSNVIKDTLEIEVGG
jgi:hypothetical protein